MPTEVQRITVLIHHPRSLVISRFEIRAATMADVMLIAQALKERIASHERN